MADGHTEDFVKTALNNAKKTLNDVSKSNVSAPQSSFAPPKEKPYNQAGSYSVARTARKAGDSKPQSGLAEEANSAGQGIAARMQNEAAAKDSLQPK